MNEHKGAEVCCVKQVKALRRESFARLVPSRLGVPPLCLFMHADIYNLSALHFYKKPGGHGRAGSPASQFVFGSSTGGLHFHGVTASNQPPPISSFAAYLSSRDLTPPLHSDNSFT